MKNNYLEAQRLMDVAQVNLDTFNPGDLPDDFTRWSDYIEIDTAANGAITKIHQRFDLLSKLDIDNKAFDLTNGNLFLERFWKIKPRKNFGADSIDARLNSLGLDTTARNKTIRAFNFAFGRKSYNTREGQLETQIGSTPWDSILPTDSFSTSDDPIDTNNNYYDIGQYYNLKDFTARFAAFIRNFREKGNPTNEDHEQWHIGNYFTEFTPGLRLVYLPALDTEEYIESLRTAGGGGSEFTGIINDLLKNNDNTDNSDREHRLKELAKTYKLYYIEEKIQRGYVVPGGSPPKLEGVVEHDSLTVALYPFPILDTTSDNYAPEGYDECDDAYSYNNDYSEYFDNNAKSTSIWDFENLRAEKIATDEYDELIVKLTHDSNTDFKLLFDFIFPLGRYLSMFNVYSMMASSSIPDINEAFTETKDRLWGIYGILTSGGDYRYEPGPSNEENLRLIERWSQGKGGDECCNEFDGEFYSLEGLLGMPALNIKGAKNPFSGNGLKYVTKLLKETGEMIFKQLVEISDPNIMVASGIRRVMKAVGICKWQQGLPPLWLVSLGLLPPPISPWGVPITPLGVIYAIIHEDEECVISDASVPEGVTDCSTVEDCTYIGTPTPTGYEAKAGSVLSPGGKGSIGEIPGVQEELDDLARWAENPPWQLPFMDPNIPFEDLTMTPGTFTTPQLEGLAGSMGRPFGLPTAMDNAIQEGLGTLEGTTEEGFAGLAGDLGTIGGEVESLQNWRNTNAIDTENIGQIWEAGSGLWSTTEFTGIQNSVNSFDAWRTGDAGTDGTFASAVGNFLTSGTLGPAIAGLEGDNYNFVTQSGLATEGFVTQTSLATEGFVTQTSLDTENFATTFEMNSAILNSNFVTVNVLANEGFITEAKLDESLSDDNMEQMTRNALNLILVNADSEMRSMFGLGDLNLDNKKIDGKDMPDIDGTFQSFTTAEDDDDDD